jgi:hypothetical protein
MSMNRFACGLALIVAVSLGAVAQAEDLAKTVAVRLRDSGTLDGYRVKVRAKQGTVWLEGEVSDAKNIAAAIGLAESTVGVERVVNRLTVASSAPVRQSNLALPQRAWDFAGVTPPSPRQPQPLAKDTTADYGNTQQTGWASEGDPGRAAESAGLVGEVAQGLRMPARMAGLPRPMRSSTPVQPVGMRAMSQPEMMNGERVVPGSMRVYEGPAGGMPTEAVPVPGQMPGPGQMSGMAMGAPRPMGAAGVGMPPVPMRGDGPNMPNYAWPSYASYPNYAALQYPTQYSPTAWPYIGPFYPYPQVPLGWRRVSLEWDDGWWYVDFDERHIHSHHR